MKRLLARLVSVVLVSLAASLVKAAPIEATLESVYAGVEPQIQVRTYFLSLKNTGPDVRGEVVGSGSVGQLRIPVELPRNSTKTVKVEIPTGGYGWDEKVTWRLGSSLGQIEPSGGPGFERSYATITSGAGVAPPPRGTKKVIYQEALVKPENAPENAMAYHGLTAVFLAEGSERLSDGAVRALQNYALLGGEVVFSTGAVTSPLRDPRWQGWLPIKTFEVENRMPATGVLPRAEMANLRAQPAENAVASQGAPAGWWKPAGLGAIHVAAYDLTERPMRQLHLVESFLSSLASKRTGYSTPPTTPYQNMNRSDYPGLTLAEDWTTGAEAAQGAAPPPAPGATAMPPGEPQDPFTVTPPSPWVVFGILALYWVILIPVHFGILAKIGRQNAAWVTAPLIALGFSIAFFSFASGLMGADEAKRQKGVLLAAAGQKEGYFHGRVSLFFPQAGSYDLKMEGVDAAWETSVGEGQVSTSGFIKLDEVEAPQYIVPNLGFREFNAGQRINLGGGLQASVQRTMKGGEAVIEASVTNRTPFAIEEARLSLEGLEGEPQSLGTGEAKTFQITLPPSTFAKKSWRVFLSGRVLKVPVGSTRATASLPNDQVTLIASLAAFPERAR